MKQSWLMLWAALLTVVGLSGCTHLESGAPVRLETSEHWLILPLENLAETPRAGERVESILQSLLQNRGVRQVALYPKQNSEDLSLLLDDGKRVAAAKDWAKGQNFRYGITGSIQEWRYKTGLDGEPAVGITLNLVDLKHNDHVLWSATAARTGWGSENLTVTTTKVLNAIIGEMELTP